MKMLRSKKALSPVIATIILIAVTVAVSLAVAAWMGALTFSFTKTDMFNVASCTFMPVGGPTYSYINMSIQNTGSSSWTITSTAQINAITNVPLNYTDGSTSLSCAAGATIHVCLKPSANTLVSGNSYSITILLTDGNKITYVAIAP